MTSLAHLNEFSASFARTLFAAIPELQKHVSPDKDLLLVELEPGPPRKDCDFWISTDDEEVTVGFGMYHRHFNWPLTEPYYPDHDPIAFVQAIMADQALIEDWTLDGEWSGSSFLAANEDPDLKDIEPGHVVHIRSWSGNADREIRGSDPNA